MEELKEILREAFGESSDSEAEDELRELKSSSIVESESIFGAKRSWEQITEINGLWLCRDFLSSDQQCLLISAIQAEGWFTEASQNQAMRFGDLPEWAVELSNSIRDVILFNNYVQEPPGLANCGNGHEATLFPPDLLWREPLFDQLIANVYEPGEGICAHVDLMRFEDGIAIVSLESTCVMHFTRVETEVCDVENECGRVIPSNKVPVLLTPGSLALMWGEARYLWKHEINRKPGFQEWEGREISQKRRISVTLRRLCQNE
ncbi:alkylated DNA repair protein alkB homolog 8 [Ipomoea triloba]|uniref:alkylated DNA repair protein alkB homolog 8 n=1 Tax=Ipomoea triloba TaxID=35885 RepID=UPI00125E80DB|nr:alkylated DNA repair protein alkB homolog 8 [Ipomoea triloba]